jgi:hypothetical protein
MVTEYWSTVDVTIQPTASGSCERRTALPPGAYRIDVPVYPTVADATAKMLARTASQSFTLPASGDVVDVALGLSP